MSVTETLWKLVPQKNKFVKYSMIAIPGKPHETKYGQVQRSKVAGTYDYHRIYPDKFLPSFISVLHKDNDHEVSPVEKRIC